MNAMVSALAIIGALLFAVGIGIGYFLGMGKSEQNLEALKSVFRDHPTYRYTTETKIIKRGPTTPPNAGKKA